MSQKATQKHDVLTNIGSRKCQYAALESMFSRFKPLAYCKEQPHCGAKARDCLLHAIFKPASTLNDESNLNACIVCTSCLYSCSFQTNIVTESSILKFWSPSSYSSN